MVPFGGFEDGLTGRSFLIGKRAPGGALFLCAGAVCHGKCRPEIDDHRLPFEFFDCLLDGRQPFCNLISLPCGVTASTHIIFNIRALYVMG